MNIPVVFDLAVQLGLLLGVEKINTLPGAYICKVDNRWTFAVNGTEKPVAVDLGKDSMGIDELRCFHMAVWFNGWLAGIINPAGGTICAGEAGNEDALIKALNDRIAVERLAKEMSQ